MTGIGKQQLRIETLVCGPLQNNVYLLIDDQSGQALAVDPAMQSAPAVQAAIKKHGVTLSLIVATHNHWDHVAEAGELATATGVGIAAHQLDAPRMASPIRPMMMPQMEFPAAPVTQELQDGDTVLVGDVGLTVIHTPGHTPGSICLHHADSGTLIAGDTLFAGSFGRYDLPGGDPVALRQSLLRLAGLPAATRVYPGHGPATTIGRETWLANPPL